MFRHELKINNTIKITACLKSFALLAEKPRFLIQTIECHGIGKIKSYKS